jgi:microcystin-dependent protein
VSTPFVGEIRVVAGTFAPDGWMLCNGQLLAISDNEVLFTLIGTTYGGDGRITFALPDLQGRTPLHTSGALPIGGNGGEQSHVLTTAEMPQHTHVVTASSNAADQALPTGSLSAPGTRAAYSGGVDSAMATTVGSVGGGQPHDNLSPYLVLSYVIALQGIFPSRS